jgi:hypothetical protein
MALHKSFLSPDEASTVSVTIWTKSPRLSK